MSSSFPSGLDEFLSVADNPAMNASGRTATQVITQLQSALAAVQAVIGVTGSGAPGTIEKRLADLADALGAPVIVSATAPSSPANGTAWLDTGATPAALKIWVSGSPGAWSQVSVQAVTAAAPLTSTGGATPQIGLPPATPSAAGHMTAAQAAKLEGIQANAAALGSTPGTALASTGSAGTATSAARSDHVHPRPTAGDIGAQSTLASSTSNTISGNQVLRAELTGDVTAAANSNSTTIANDAVTNAKLANVGAGTIKGRATAGTGDPEDLTAAQARALLNVADGAAALGSTAGAALAAAGAAGTAGTAARSDHVHPRPTPADIGAQPTLASSTTNTVSGNQVQRAALTGDVTAAANSNSTTIANDAVTNAKLANMGAGTIKGRATAGTGDPEDLTAAQARALLNVADGAAALGSSAGAALAAAGAAGTAGTAARSDHVHPRPTAADIGALTASDLKTVGGESVSGVGDIKVGASAEIIFEWTTPGSYLGITRPDPALYPYCDAILIGPGGGGGAGRRGATTEACLGGGGGSGGELIAVSLLTSSIAEAFNAIVGAGGLGAPGATSDNTDGAAGANGGNTDLFPISGANLSPSSRLRARGGLGGAGGTTTSGAGGAARATFSGSTAFNDGAGGAAALAGPGQDATTLGMRPAGGGGGASLIANLTSEHSGGGSICALHIAASGGNPAATGAGSNGSAAFVLRSAFPSTGGGGGASKQASAAGPGGNGSRGSGGGGAGASRNGNASGVGGNGGDGYIRLRFYK